MMNIKIKSYSPRSIYDPRDLIGGIFFSEIFLRDSLHIKVEFYPLLLKVPIDNCKIATIIKIPLCDAV